MRQEIDMEHHVYFWLKDEFKTAENCAAFEKALDELLKVGEISGGLWGKSAATPERSVTDKSFDYALSVTFDSIEKHNAYQVHPDHDVFVDAYKSWWEQVRIMDID